MSVFASPLPTKLAAAVVAAGVTAAGAVIEVPDTRESATVAANVANASVVTDLLQSVGEVAAGFGYGTAYAIDAAVSLPFDSAAALLTAVQHPSILPSIASWLLHRYLDPENGSWFSYAEQLTYDAWLIGSNIPLLGPILGSAIDDVAQRISNWLNAVLPDQTDGALAVDYFQDVTDLGRLLRSFNGALLVPVWVVADVAYYLGFLPVSLEASFEAALRNPADIPGLLSWLAHGLLGRDGLAGWLLEDLAAPLYTLPGPVGAFAWDVYTRAADGLDGLLDLLPEPISPYGVTDSPDQVTDDAGRATGSDDGAAATDPGTSTGTGAGTGIDDGAAAEGTEKLEPPAEDVAAEPVSRAARSALKVKAGNKFVPGSVVTDAEPAGAGDAGGEEAAGEDGPDASLGADDAGADADATDAGADADATDASAGGSNLPRTRRGPAPRGPGRRRFGSGRRRCQF